MSLPQKTAGTVTSEKLQSDNIPQKGPVKCPDLSVVIPVYNEADAIGQLLTETRNALEDRFNYEIITVDDGSTDSTSDVLVKLMNEPDLPLRVVRHINNYGQSAAIFSGIESAHAPWIITLDGDGQNNPADILKLITERDNTDLPELKLVCGYRKKRNDNFIKRLSSRVANKVRNMFLHDYTPDTGCGLKLIHRDTFLKLPFFDHMHRFIPALMRRGGADILSVEVSHRPRETGISKYTVNNRLWVGIVDLFGLLWLNKRAVKPVKEEITHYER